MVTGRSLHSQSVGYHAAIRSAIERIFDNEQIDVVHVDGISMAQYVPATWRGPVVLDDRGASREAVGLASVDQAPAVGQWLAVRRARALRATHAAACRRATVTLAASDADRGSLEQIVGSPWSIHVVPTGIDLTALESIWQHRAPESGRLLTAGTFGDTSDENGIAWFLHEVFPLIRLRMPTVHYDIIGTGSREARLAALNNTDVSFHSRKQSQPGLMLRANVFIAPGPAGVDAQTRILEAMAVGIPVIATPDACRGLHVTAGQHLLVGEDAADLPEDPDAHA